jgi:hypothetical protein
VLHLLSTVERGVHPVIEAYQAAMPDVVDLARRLLAPTADILRAMPLAEALVAWWPDLVGA